MSNEHVRYFVLARDFGMPPTVVDEQPGYELDWLLQIAGKEAKVRNEKNV